MTEHVWIRCPRSLRWECHGCGSHLYSDQCPRALHGSNSVTSFRGGDEYIRSPERHCHSDCKVQMIKKILTA